MDFQTIFMNILELIETAAMLGGLVYITRALRIKDDAALSKAMYLKGGGFMVLFAALNVLTNYLVK